VGEQGVDARRGPVAVIGLGSMGLGIAISLLRAGFDVVGVDSNPLAVERFKASGGRGAATPAAAADGAVAVVTVVVNVLQTRDVLFGASGAVPVMPASGVVISCATMSPDDARGLAAEVESRQLLYLDAPISGGAIRAIKGELSVLASGSPEAFGAAQPVLIAIAQTVHRLGDRPGIAAAFKVVNQLLAGVHIAAACEAIVFARRQDLDLVKVYEVIKGSAGNSWMFENRVPHILAADYSPRSAVNIFTKDLGIVMRLAEELKMPTPIAAKALQLFQMTAESGMGLDDDASVARLYAMMAGIDLPGISEDQNAERGG
jgi:putative dehydrogenase